MDKAETEAEVFIAFSRVFLVLDIAGCGLLAFLLYFGSGVTNVIGELANNYITPLGRILLVIIPIIAALILILKEIAIKRRMVTFIINLVAGIGLVIFIPLYFLSVFCSIFSLVTSLGK